MQRISIKNLNRAIERAGIKAGDLAKEHMDNYWLKIQTADGAATAAFSARQLTKFIFFDGLCLPREIENLEISEVFFLYFMFFLDARRPGYFQILNGPMIVPITMDPGDLIEDWRTDRDGN